MLSVLRLLKKKLTFEEPLLIMEFMLSIEADLLPALFIVFGLECLSLTASDYSVKT